MCQSYSISILTFDGSSIGQKQTKNVPKKNYIYIYIYLLKSNGSIIIIKQGYSKRGVCNYRGKKEEKAKIKKKKRRVW